MAMIIIDRQKGVIFMEILKVSSNSNSDSVAAALAGVISEHGKAEIQAIGAEAVNKAIKAIAIARGMVSPTGFDLICIPTFTDIETAGEDRTVIKLIVQQK